MPPRRPKSKQKLPPKPAIQKEPSDVEEEKKAEEKFRIELQWCVQQLETAMQKTSLKEKEDMSKAHRSLTSSKVPLIKKRQVMNSLFGDYRAKMAQEEAKMKIEKPKLKKHSTIPSKSMFLRKSADIPTVEHATHESQEGHGQTHPTQETLSNQSGSSSVLNDKEKDVNTAEEASCSEKDLLEESKNTLSAYFKSTQSKEMFKFNFSSVS